jgi:hypothetical protein
MTKDIFDRKPIAESKTDKSEVAVEGGNLKQLFGTVTKEKLILGLTLNEDINPVLKYEFALDTDNDSVQNYSVWMKGGGDVKGLFMCIIAEKSESRVLTEDHVLDPKKISWKTDKRRISCEIPLDEIGNPKVIGVEARIHYTQKGKDIVDRGQFGQHPTTVPIAKET